MNDPEDPYQIPTDAQDQAPAQRFASWSTPILVAIFFIPSAFFAIALFAGFFLENLALNRIFFYLTIISAIAIPLLSAYIDTHRGSGRLGTFALLTFVHILAQLLALGLLRFGLEIFLRS